MDTVTVTAANRKFALAFSKLPGETFGPYDFAETVRELRVGALLEPAEARDVVMDAAVTGRETINTG